MTTLTSRLRRVVLQQAGADLRATLRLVGAKPTVTKADGMPLSYDVVVHDSHGGVACCDLIT